MRVRRTTSILAVPMLLSVAGCGYVHVGRAPAPITTTTIVGDATLMKENADLQTEKKLLQQELALTRAQGTALRTALENRAADGDTSKKLIDKLNETTRELATLRATYARLQTERNEAVASAGEAKGLRTRLGEAEEKLAASLRTYTQLQEEVSRLRTDVDRTRAENVALGEQVKSATAQNEQAQAALAQLNTDLLAQKDARHRAEQDADTLRTELKAVAPNASVLAQQRTGAAAEARSLVSEHAAETAALKAQLETLQKEVAALGEERAKLRQQAGAAGAPDASVEAVLSTALKNAQTLREQLQQTQAQASALTEENARLKSRLTPRAPEVVEAAAGAKAVVVAPPTTITLSPRPTGVNATLVANVPGANRGTAQPDTPAATGDGQGRLHVVTGGDTLARISTQYYGTPGRWGDILAANREVLGENNNLVVGRTLRIP